ncbi:MAG: hypothetical protein EXX96DRAFT_517368 [Benjaminiella poitrasii]|nr:MAG: hypothetical protein EXX96DRAFT_517368 [Benjaminiella poitrasii]
MAPLNRSSSQPFLTPSNDKLINVTNYESNSSTTVPYSVTQEEQQVKNTEENKVNRHESKPKNKDKSTARVEQLKMTWTYLKPLATMLVINVGVPLALYYVLKIWLSPLIALILSGIPPLLHVIYTGWKKRRLDILGCIFVVSYTISAVLTVISGDIRLSLLRDSATTALVSLLFFFTLIPLHTRWFTVRPFIFLVTQQILSEQPDVEWTDRKGIQHSMNRAEWVWSYIPAFRKFCYFLTAGWSFALMIEFVIKIIMIEATHLTVDQIILYGNIIIAVIIVLMTLITILSRNLLLKKAVSVSEEWHKQNNYNNRLPQ